MARVYSRRKGQAGSTRPSVRKAPTWQSYKPAEVEALIVKLAKEGKTPSQIGMTLRDSYGIPDVKASTKKQIAEILREKNAMMKLPEDLTALLKHVIELQKHIERNKQDMSAGRGLTITESKIGRIVKYYKRSKRLPETWKYDRNNVQLLLK
ncbi:30S ribosomal protein S15 [Candidatus Woesearchaeota archaeon]|nr:30S ribosomal protein S15 [Candidatus Woesearchaeota archaeon]